MHLVTREPSLYRNNFPVDELSQTFILLMIFFEPKTNLSTP